MRASGPGAPVVVLALLISSCRAQDPGAVLEATPIPVGAQRAVVERLVDGDTFWVRASGPGPLPPGRLSKVRLLEYDTPERGDCWFAEATAALRRLAPPGATVWLAPDRELVDRYGRALRYAWTEDGTFVDLAMVLAGAGRSLLVRPNDAHIDQIRAAEAEARQARRGLWGAC